MINVVSHSLSSKNKVCSVTPSSSAVRGGGGGTGASSFEELQSCNL